MPRTMRFAIVGWLCCSWPAAQTTPEVGPGALREVCPGVQFHEAQGRLSRVYGPPMGCGADARESAELFLAAWSELFGAESEDVLFTETRELMDRGLVAARFVQRYASVPVHNTWLTVVTCPAAGYGIVLISNNLCGVREISLP